MQEYILNIFVIAWTFSNICMIYCIIRDKYKHAKKVKEQRKKQMDLEKY